MEYEKSPRQLMESKRRSSIENSNKLTALWAGKVISKQYQYNTPKDFMRIQNSSPVLPKGAASTSMVPGWRITITGIPTSKWWEAHKHLVGCFAGVIFSGSSFPKK
jgi:hypothetical protein